MIGLYANQNKEQSCEVCKQLNIELENRGIKSKILSRNFSEEPTVIIVIGGDGTVLDVAQKALELDVPILSINAGRTGFLSCFEMDEIKECVDFIAEGKYEIEERPLLFCEYSSGSCLAVNEICVQRPSGRNVNSCTVSLSLTIDSAFVDCFRADGIIVATPTGSTAYSLSAGGAILAPKLSAFIATPLCAHTLRSKSIVFSDDAKTEIVVNSPLAEVYSDGVYKTEIRNGEIITICKSNKKIKFIRGKDCFYKKLYEKLTFWSGN